ncbi:MAG: KEOPS complex kinase/ATPase Bud32 [Candidatus Methanomethylophilaceae archaeon]|jgi:TP53 regulating kinase-like protein/N6-L-threonylcarbamoyladenine synthase/protein kinase Bud32|nr:KEOPS complex kinase/ATPase Bud32 [Candidatus Methanomethylophilaceae archaeon]NLF34227.1 Kae1-associated serine/threonine protein kinase [Thermoplasmatales archaeon]
MEYGEVLAVGAEAEVYETEFIGRRAVCKVRPPKAYRHPDLDSRLRASRTRNEVRVTKDARGSGVRTPVIYDVDLGGCRITMEYVRGRKVRDVLDDAPGMAHRVCRMIGRTVAGLHGAGICHGDLTTSNMILTPDDEMCLIDFSLGATRVDIEEMGVDMHLLERAFASSHSEIADAYGSVVDSYMGSMEDAHAVMDRVDDIKSRGRYT